MVGRPAIFTDDVLSSIRKMLDDGLDLGVVAAKIGCTVGSLEVTLSKAGISHRRFELRALVPPATKLGFDAKARELRLTTDQLLTRLVVMIERDGLFEAVLDDG